MTIAQSMHANLFLFLHILYYTLSVPSLFMWHTSMRVTTYFSNALFVSVLMFSGKLLIFQRAFSRKLSHFPVFDNDLENELENVC